MVDSLYNHTSVPDELRPLFDQLQKEFAKEYEIWVRVEDFGRSVSAAIVNRPKSIAVTISLRRGSQDIRNTLDPLEIGRIRNHLTPAATEDLVL